MCGPKEHFFEQPAARNHHRIHPDAYASTADFSLSSVHEKPRPPSFKYSLLPPLYFLRGLLESKEHHPHRNRPFCFVLIKSSLPHAPPPPAGLSHLVRPPSSTKLILHARILAVLHSALLILASGVSCLPSFSHSAPMRPRAWRPQ